MNIEIAAKRNNKNKYFFCRMFDPVTAGRIKTQSVEAGEAGKAVVAGRTAACALLLAALLGGCSEPTDGYCDSADMCSEGSRCDMQARRCMSEEEDSEEENAEETDGGISADLKTDIEGGISADLKTDTHSDLKMDAPKPDAPKLPLGLAQACTAAQDCASGFCVDGVCCNLACDGECSSCSLEGQLGICSSVPNGERCGNAGYCEAGSCTRKLQNGGSCTQDAMCHSGHCVDNVCCDRACPPNHVCYPASGYIPNGFQTAQECSTGTCETVTTACGLRPCDSSGKHCDIEILAETRGSSN